jgi:hypothetical protein
MTKRYNTSMAAVRITISEVTAAILAREVADIFECGKVEYHSVAPIAAAAWAE